MSPRRKKIIKMELTRTDPHVGSGVMKESGLAPANQYASTRGTRTFESVQKKHPDTIISAHSIKILYALYINQTISAVRNDLLQFKCMQYQYFLWFIYNIFVIAGTHHIFTCTFSRTKIAG